MEEHVFRVVAKLRNNRLIKAREELGLGCRQAAEQMGISYGLLIGYESLKHEPWSARGGWKDSARTISEWYGFGLDYLWPEVIKKVQATTTTLMLDEPQVQISLEDAVETHKQLPAATQKVLKTLRPRERYVIEQRLGLKDKHGEGKTLEEVAVLLGKRRARKAKKPIKDAEPYNRERIRQIEAKAFRQLRHPSRSKILKPFIDATPPPTPEELEEQKKQKVAAAEREAEERRLRNERRKREAEERANRDRLWMHLRLFVLFCQAEQLVQHYLSMGCEEKESRHWALAYHLAFYPDLFYRFKFTWSYELSRSVVWARGEIARIKRQKEEEEASASSCQ